MKLGLAVTIYCSVCDRGFPGEAFVYVPHGWGVEAFLDRAKPLDPEAGVISNDGGGNRFTCTECARAKLAPPLEAGS